jgi:hypothetical protein
MAVRLVGRINPTSSSTSPSMGRTKTGEEKRAAVFRRVRITIIFSQKKGFYG